MNMRADVWKTWSISTHEAEQNVDGTRFQCQGSACKVPVPLIHSGFKSHPVQGQFILPPLLEGDRGETAPKELKSCRKGAVFDEFSL